MNIIKTFKLSAIASCLAVVAHVSIAADYSRAEKELRIMSKIFDTSISESKSNNRGHRFPGSTKTTDSTYLAKQGMVFTFGFSQSRFGDSSDWQAFGEGIGHLVGSIRSKIAHSLADIDLETPVAPIAQAAARENFSEHGSQDQVGAYEEFQESMEHMREEQRDKREEVRDIQRSIRDLERRERREEVDTKELNKTKIKLEEKMKVLDKKLVQYEKSMQEYRSKKIAKVKISNKKKSDLIISTLCDYGATLRSLENGQHVTLIFSNFENNKDQIYVFNYKDVKSCSSKDKLIKKAVSYQI
ncbi:MAG: hypothetical protein ACJAS9_003714 [Polaribacter sp.]|jgi:hypothetical protein